MRVRVRLFASLRDAAECEEVDLQIADGATADEVWRALVLQIPKIASHRSSLTVAVNRRYATFDTPLEDGDEVVFIPPIAGG
jgi:molybdopterin converting factor subunit 1